jgi:hypothetical protein
MIMRLVLILLACLWSSVAEAQSVRTVRPGVPPPAASIDEVAWLVGHWEGKGLGGQSFETISPPVAGQISGHFQQVVGGKIRFYEIYQIVPVGNSLVFRLKHFNADLTGWEEKDQTVEFPLVAIEKEAVYFDGLTMRLAGEGQLESAVSIKQRDGTVQTETFRFRRVKL